MTNLDHCVGCGNDLFDADDQRCTNCGLTDPGNPASRVWADNPLARGGHYGGNMRDALGHEG